ncbi:trissin [Rhynchophorus ferrugineus]|uniref:Trissin n=1 Tax=Rhynchophorus ferrugineus TaxID=354439 RepID=A0A834IPI5_RHYFE|nr:hypothetical protein GWI33_022859 [Rhynchophorus ferrugineus]
MNKELLVVFIILGVVWGAVETCNSCGSECQSACGTRHFRTCCFNYLKKRSNPEPLPLTLDPSLRLELWLAKSKYPYFQSRTVSQEALELPEISSRHDREDDNSDN